MNIGIVWILAATIGDGLSSPGTELFTAESFVCPSGPFEGRSFDYQLFVPSTSGRNERLPLIIWMHGFGEAGHNNVSQLRYLEDVIFTSKRREIYRFFLLAVQCPLDQPSWFDQHAAAAVEESDKPPAMRDMVDLNMAIVDDLLVRYPIDESRVSAAGVCSGGRSCWELAFRYGSRLSAIAPIASAGVNILSPEDLKGLPIWAFHSRYDNPVALGQQKRIVDTIQGLGGNARLTEFETAVHDAWTPAFRQQGLLNWLLAQRRGSSPSIWASRSYSNLESKTTLFLNGWSWSAVFLQAAYITFLIGLFIAAHRFRLKSRVRSAYTGNGE
jgi:predicted peptidase